MKVLVTPLLLVLEVCNVKPTYRKSWAGNLLMCLDLTLDPSFKVKRGQSNLKVLITCLLLVLEVCNVKPTYRKSWAGNLLICSDLTLSPSSRSNEYTQTCCPVVAAVSVEIKLVGVLQPKSMHGFSPNFN